MRWEGRSLSVEDPAALPGMGRLAGLVRTVRTPEFAGVTFHEVHCRSALNKVPGNSPMPFGWTINPYRGCSHGCVYCFARNTHSYLDFDTGHDFDSQIVVKINIGDVLRKEVAAGKWRREHVAMGTNTDPYQRAEGRYRLMPGDHLGAGGQRDTVLDPDQGHRAVPRSRPAERRLGLGVGGHGGVAGAAGPGTPVHAGTGHAHPSGTAGAGAADPRCRAAVRGVRGARCCRT